MLASHKNNYEIIKMLLNKGFVLTVPHHIKCKCDQCFDERANDFLRHSRSRINAYRALGSPTLIGLTTKDPLLTAFQLSLQLKRLSDLETEFRIEYMQLREKVQNFAVSLLDHVRTFTELMVILNYDPKTDNKSNHSTKFERLKLAIDYEQKEFVAHPIFQLMLETILFKGMPGFKRKGPLGQIWEVLFIALKCPFYSICTLLKPNSRFAMNANQPFIKFINHSSSYCFFLCKQTLSLFIITSYSIDCCNHFLYKCKTLSIIQK
jgi:transient receptor potential cation channel subfamily C